MSKDSGIREKPVDGEELASLLKNRGEACAVVVIIPQDGNVTVGSDVPAQLAPELLQAAAISLARLAFALDQEATETIN